MTKLFVQSSPVFGGVGDRRLVVCCEAEERVFGLMEAQSKVSQLNAGYPYQRKGIAQHLQTKEVTKNELKDLPIIQRDICLLITFTER